MPPTPIKRQIGLSFQIRSSRARYRAWIRKIDGWLVNRARSVDFWVQGKKKDDAADHKRFWATDYICRRLAYMLLYVHISPILISR